MNETINKLLILLFPIDYNNKLVVLACFFYSSDISGYDFHSLHHKIAKRF